MGPDDEAYKVNPSMATALPNPPVSSKHPSASQGPDFIHPSKVPPDYSHFITTGFVSLAGNPQKVPVKILRDTGGSVSFILDSVLNFSEGSSLGRSVLIRDMGMHTWPVPLHKIELDSELVKGEVAVALRSSLPVEGVSVILGNDLAGGRVWEGVPPPPPIVTSGPTVLSGPDSSEKEFPEVFTACAVTRSMGGAGPEEGGKEPPKQSTVQLTDLPLSLSESELVVAQQEDPELKSLFGEVKSTEEMECGTWVLCTG